MGEVRHVADLIGKLVGNMDSPIGNPATSAAGIAGNIAVPLAESALVSDAARAQLATIRDEWLAPLVERIGELERENGRLEATTVAQVEALGELRRRAEQAEAERDRLVAIQAPSAAPGSTVASTPDNPSPEPPTGFWARVRRVFGGEG